VRGSLKMLDAPSYSFVRLYLYIGKTCSAAIWTSSGWDRSGIATNFNGFRVLIIDSHGGGVRKAIGTRSSFASIRYF